MGKNPKGEYGELDMEGYGERRGSRGGYGGGYGGGGGFSPRNVPVNVGDELDVTIEAVGEKGDGIAKKDGFVLFVPGVKTGQNVKIRVTKVLRKVGFAEVIGEGSAAPAEKAEESSEEAPAKQEYAKEEAAEPAGDSDSFGEEAAEETTEVAEEE